MITQRRAPQCRMIVPEDYGESATRSAVSRTTDIDGPSDYVCEVAGADIDDEGGPKGPLVLQHWHS